METISSAVFLPARLGAAEVPRGAERGDSDLESNRFSEARPLGGRFEEIRSVAGKSSRFHPP